MNIEILRLNQLRKRYCSCKLADSLNGPNGEMINKFKYGGPLGHRHFRMP